MAHEFVLCKERHLLVTEGLSTALTIIGTVYESVTSLARRF